MFARGVRLARQGGLDKRHPAIGAEMGRRGDAPRGPEKNGGSKVGVIAAQNRKLSRRLGQEALGRVIERSDRVLDPVDVLDLGQCKQSLCLGRHPRCGKECCRSRPGPG